MENTQIQKHRYVLAVPDLQKSGKFYEKVMGFRVYPIGDPGWLFAEKDQCLIMLGESKNALSPEKLGDHAYFAYLEVNDVDAYYNFIIQNGGHIRQIPEDKPWGMREFPLKTMDGHRIMIGQAI